jgi:hypothetical protein
MAYKCNGKHYMTLERAKRAADKIYAQTGAIVAIEGTGTAQTKQSLDKRADENAGVRDTLPKDGSEGLTRHCAANKTRNGRAKRARCRV